MAYRIAREKLKFVYLGNVAGAGGEDTQCPDCGATVISRSGFSARVTGVKQGKCAHCGAGLNILSI